MIVWFRNLPQPRMDLSEWKPFIRNSWFRKHFMKFVYLLMVAFFLAASWYYWGSLNLLPGFPLILIILLVFLLHEAIHILVVKSKGDISLTFKGIYFWLNTNAILSKRRYWVFMSLPFIILTVFPAIASFFVSGDIKSLIIFISWYNLIISSSDIINSFLILLKPNRSVFCRGYYRVES